MTPGMMDSLLLDMKQREAYPCLSLDDWVCRIAGFPGKYICCYINGPHKQYIQAGIIFNYMFHLGLPGTYLGKVRKVYLSKAAPGRYVFGT